MNPQLKAMMAAYGARESGTTSRYWQELSKKNTRQLAEAGYDNFKQTVALNYFTVLTRLGDPQIGFLLRHLPVCAATTALARALAARRHPSLGAAQSLIYNFVTFMLWDYAARQGAGDILRLLDEPAVGNPFSARLGGRDISQDLAYSALEFQAITDGIPKGAPISSVMEIGAGYGRTAYVFLRLMPQLRYVIVDIPPALYLSQRYLAETFPDRRRFEFRPFDRFADVADEFQVSQIAFLLPDQLALLPDKTIDLSLAIDCLHELPPPQIARYFDEIDRLTAKWFYFSAWKTTVIPYDDIPINEGDYPARADWANVFWRDRELLTFPTCRDGVPTEGTYFHALFALPGATAPR